ncbi:unnamed protein product [Brassica oleracea]
MRSYILHQVHKAAAGKHSEDDGAISIDRLPHSRDRDRDMMKRIVNTTATMVEIVIDTLAENIVRRRNVRETIWMIMIITKVETVTGRGLSIEKERRGTGQGHALVRAAALNLSQGRIVVDSKMVGDCMSHVCAITTMHITLTLGA